MNLSVQRDTFVGECLAWMVHGLRSARSEVSARQAASRASQSWGASLCLRWRPSAIARAANLEADSLSRLRLALLIRRTRLRRSSLPAALLPRCEGRGGLPDSFRTHPPRALLARRSIRSARFSWQRRLVVMREEGRGRRAPGSRRGRSGLCPLWIAAEGGCSWLKHLLMIGSAAVRLSNREGRTLAFIPRSCRRASTVSSDPAAGRCDRCGSYMSSSSPKRSLRLSSSHWILPPLSRATTRLSTLTVSSS